MCSKTSPVEEENQKTRTSTRIEKKKRRESSTSMEFKPPNLEASREIRIKKKTKKKKKKPKFLSLKLELNTSHEITQNPKTKKKSTKQSKSKEEGSNTEKNRDGVDQNDAVADEEGDNQYDIVREKEGGDQYDTVAAYLFNSGTDSTISSIHDLLHSSSAAVDMDCSGTILSPYDHKEHGNSSSSLLRTAMRKGGSEEEGAEERWVSYSEVVEEVMSRSGTPRWCGEDDEIGGADGGGFKRHSLTLKLDYEQIMEAWSDKGTLYVDGELPQTVPDLHAAASVDGVMGGGGCSEAGNIWAVPEMEPTAMLWRGHREASLLRYKQKRQNRLFSKTIRYQVRKLNAEKRPRIKGRFVKRGDP